MCLQNPSAVLNLSGGVIEWGENPLKRRGRVEPTAFFRGIGIREDNPSVSCADSSLCTREPYRESLPYGKGRCHEVTEGIREPGNGMGRGEPTALSGQFSAPFSASCARFFAPSAAGAAGREARYSDGVREVRFLKNRENWL